MIKCKIILDNKLEAVVDKDDFEYLKKWKWHYTKNGYVVHTQHVGRITGTIPPKYSSKAIYLHRLIMGAESGVMVDHINGDKLDNRKCNLRKCSCQENNRNSSRYYAHNKSTQIRGVSFHTETDKWRAYINIERKQIHLGLFNTIENAISARIQAEKLYFGDFAPRRI